MLERSAVRSYLLFLLARAAAFSLTRWTAEKPPEVVSQSWPGFAPHIGHGKEIALTGRTSGIESVAFVTVQFRTHTAG
nr:hypothetical protein [Candidatus Acidoferrales bacterium]